MKLFQVCLITFVALFTLLILLFLLSGLATILAPGTHTTGIVAVSGGVSARLLNIVGGLVAASVLVGVLLWSARKSRK